VAHNIADQLERRISYRRAMKRAIQQAMRQGALGIKIEVAGRLAGAEMARTVTLRDGRVPLQTCVQIWILPARKQGLPMPHRYQSLDLSRRYENRS